MNDWQDKKLMTQMALFWTRSKSSTTLVKKFYFLNHFKERHNVASLTGYIGNLFSLKINDLMLLVTHAAICSCSPPSVLPFPFIRDLWWFRYLVIQKTDLFNLFLRSRYQLKWEVTSSFSPHCNFPGAKLTLSDSFFHHLCWE